MPELDSLVIVGSTCSGKTGLVRSLRDFYGDKLAIPLRYITRPRRKNDDLVENKPVFLEEFQSLVKKGLIDVWWERQMEGDRIEYYGFERVISVGRLRIYSANNAIVRDPNAKLEKLGKFKILAIKADHPVRVERLSLRSPDLSPKEIEYRLGDDGLDAIEKADFVIDNTSISIEEVNKRAQEIVSLLL